MKTRDLTVLLGLLALCLAGAWFAFSADPADPEPTPATEPAAAAPTPGEPSPRQADVPQPSAGLRAAPVTTDAPRRPRPAGAPELGIIDGRIQLAAGVAGTFSGFQVTVRELIDEGGDGPSDGTITEGPARRKPYMETRAFKAAPDESPLYFAFDRVPFSRYGYDVWVFVPGLNGSHQAVVVDETSWNPQVTLSITKGSPFALRVIDPQRSPMAGRRVQLRPLGYPLGRPVLAGETNSFGSLTFEHALAGTYAIWIDDVPIEEVDIALPGVVHDQADLGVQSRIITLESGQPVRVEVFGGGGWGLEGAALELFKIDTTENLRMQATSDHGGIHVFEHVPPGRYQLNVQARGHQPTSRTVTVVEGRAPDTLTVRVAPL
ncbi:MAG: carboxypeptidase regulatory-like domain-containing protein [Planctomycetes bacterium]|nr:carboxypeptidase regulatory-like domain-containing protein [Planctomycetota bacterium]